MKSLNILFFTGRTGINTSIATKLQTGLAGFAFNVTTEKSDADLIVCLPEYIKLFNNVPILTLTDSSKSFIDNENVVEYTPFPVSEDDFLRLEWRIISAGQSIRLEDDT